MWVRVDIYLSHSRILILSVADLGISEISRRGREDRSMLLARENAITYFPRKIFVAEEERGKKETREKESPVFLSPAG